MDRSKLNKVLNRPLFRQQALKKGDLKPIKAQTGVMVGTNPFGPKGVMVGSPTTPAMNLPVPAGPVIDRTPGMFQKGIKFLGNQFSKVQPYLDVTSPKFYKGIGNLTADYFAYPYLEKAGRSITGSEVGGSALGLAGLLNPISRGAGVLSFLGDVTLKPKLDPKTNVLSTRFGDISNFMPQSYYGLQEAKKVEAEKRAQASKKRNIANLLVPPTTGDPSGLSYGMASDTPEFTYMSKEQQDKVIGQNAKKLAREANIPIRKAANIVRASFFKEINPAEASRAVADDAVYAQTVSNTYNDPNLSTASTTTPQGPEQSEGAIQTAKSEEPKKLGDGNVTKQNYSKEEVNNPKTVNNVTVDNSLIDRAKQIADELSSGRSSQAGTIFLANLASGLLRGTTNKSGVGGALEVLGNALGPAVSNYSIIKLKENEIENKLMGDAINAAAKEFALANKAKKNPKGGLGRAQFVTDDGKYVNFESVIGQDGFVRIQTSEGLVRVAPGTSINLGGQKLNYVRAVKKDTIGDEEQKSIRALGQRVKSLNVLYDAKDIIIRTRTAGAKGKLALLKSRLGSAISDFSGGTLDGLTESQSRSLEEEFNKAIQNSDMTDEKKKELRKKYGFEKLKDKAKKDIKKYLGSEEITSDELEKLAVAEVTLTYALANSFKDTDRLTQRDIDAADRVVGIFPLLGGSGTVLSKLNSLEADLLRDVKNLETKLRQQHFVVESAITNNLLQLKGYQENKPIKRRKLTKEEIEGIFKDI